MLFIEKTMQCVLCVYTWHGFVVYESNYKYRGCELQNVSTEMWLAIMYIL